MTQPESRHSGRGRPPKYVSQHGPPGSPEKLPTVGQDPVGVDVDWDDGGALRDRRGRWVDPDPTRPDHRCK